MIDIGRAEPLSMLSPYAVPFTDDVDVPIPAVPDTKSLPSPASTLPYVLPIATPPVVPNRVFTVEPAPLRTMNTTLSILKMFALGPPRA